MGIDTMSKGEGPKGGVGGGRERDGERDKENRMTSARRCNSADFS